MHTLLNTQCIMNAGDEKALLEISNHKKKLKNLKVKKMDMRNVHQNI